jgi:hypothetical protein
VKGTIMNTQKKFALVFASVCMAFGCAASEPAESEPQVASEDLVMFPGSVDQAGIVESTTMMLISHATDLATSLDSYNQEDPFAIKASSYRDAFAKNLNKFDSRDGKAEWTSEQSQKWAQRMASGNYQVIDTSKPCDWQNPHTYLEIERAQLTGQRHTTCGGRMPNEDAMDVTLNFLVRGPAANITGEGALRDGVDQATQKSTDTFPYLADLNE